MDKEEAREQIDVAIRNYLAVTDMLEPDELVSSWAMIVHMQKVEDDGRAYYVTITNSGIMPAHVIQGLFYEGLTAKRD